MRVSDIMTASVDSIRSTETCLERKTATNRASEGPPVLCCTSAKGPPSYAACDRSGHPPSYALPSRSSEWMKALPDRFYCAGPRNLPGLFASETLLRRCN